MEDIDLCISQVAYMVLQPLHGEVLPSNIDHQCSLGVVGPVSNGPETDRGTLRQKLQQGASPIEDAGIRIGADGYRPCYVHRVPFRSKTGIRGCQQAEADIAGIWRAHDGLCGYPGKVLQVCRKNVSRCGQLSPAGGIDYDARSSTEGIRARGNGPLLRGGDRYERGQNCNRS